MKSAIFSVILGILLLNTFTYGQENTKPSIYINCQKARCYETFLFTELSYFEITRDLAAADIQILIRDQGNASGGVNYQLNFIGQKLLVGKDYLIEFNTEMSDTESLARKKLLNHINQGLIYYLLGTDYFKDLESSFPKYSKGNTQNSKNETDPWNRWIFGIGASGVLDGESNKKAVRLSGNVRGGRTTDDSKFSFYTYFNNKSNSVTIDQVTEKVKVSDYGFNALYVASFSDHWSVGGLIKGFHSIYSNIDFSNSLAPAVEYSIFPVEDFNKKQFRWIYQAGYRKLNYIEETIFDKMTEGLPYQQVTGILGITEPWGNFSAELNGYQYLSDLEKYRLSLELELSWRITQGLALRFYGTGSQIKNQISLAKTETSTSELLLGGQQLPTSFDYYTSFGLNYTFGSLKNSIVNPRFSGVN